MAQLCKIICLIVLALGLLPARAAAQTGTLTDDPSADFPPSGLFPCRELPVSVVAAMDRRADRATYWSPTEVVELSEVGRGAGESAAGIVQEFLYSVEC
jgi:hypothetical protein